MSDDVMMRIDRMQEALTTQRQDALIPLNHSEQALKFAKAAQESCTLSAAQIAVMFRTIHALDMRVSEIERARDRPH